MFEKGPSVGPEPEKIASVCTGIPSTATSTEYQHLGMIVRAATGKDYCVDRDFVLQILSKALPPAPPQPGELLTAEEAASVIGGLSRSTFLAYHSSGRVPLPVYLSERCVRWRRQELVAWMRSGCPKRDVWERQKKTLASKAI